MEENAYRILIVDDERDFVWALERSLREDGYETLTANNGAQAHASVSRHDFDLIILDVNMPGMDGFEVCHQFRQMHISAPVLFLTARVDVRDRVNGLDHGGDDYLSKPFNTTELKARVRALLRRRRRESGKTMGPERSGSVLEAGPLALVMESREVRIGNMAAKLTPKEVELLRHFMLHAGEVFTSGELLEQVWGYPSESSCVSLVRWHVKSLRDKIEPDPSSPVYLRTEPHQGYVLMPMRQTAEGDL
ncbi:MAG: response regulator transcription factor [Armatimonadota bacterium]|nr:response regulator transcription factor [Armatimonadota bacterium]